MEVFFHSCACPGRKMDIFMTCDSKNEQIHEEDGYMSTLLFCFIMVMFISTNRDWAENMQGLYKKIPWFSLWILVVSGIPMVLFV